MAAKRLWSQEYRPKTLEGYVFQNEQQAQQIRGWIASGDVPHLLLTGLQGSGKTTLAEILIHELEIDDADVLRINASDKTGVDYIRDTILAFASTLPIGTFKIVKLEEFDYMSQAAQGMLRAVLEESSDTCRFICTCNYEHKIIPALKSRFQQQRFKAPARDDVFMRACEVLIAEGVEFEPEVLDLYVTQAYPDIRKLINNLQLNSVDSKLLKPTHDVDGGDYQFKLIDLLGAGDLRQLGAVVLEQCSAEQLTEVYELLYKNLRKHPAFAKDNGRYEQALLTLLDAVHKHGLVAIPHLNFEALIIRLSNI